MPVDRKARAWSQSFVLGMHIIGVCLAASDRLSGRLSADELPSPARIGRSFTPLNGHAEVRSTLTKDA